jgi:hypothetical protein
MGNVAGICTAHDESGSPINHRIPNLTHLVIAQVTRKNDLALHLSLESLGCLFGYGFFTSIFSWIAEMLECIGLEGRCVGANRRFRLSCCVHFSGLVARNTNWLGIPTG